MPEETIPMLDKMQIVALAEAGVPKTAIAARFGVSRQVVHKWLSRFRGEGELGLQELSRRPSRSPNQTPADIEDEIVRLRKQLTDEGWDAGAWSIRARLARKGVAVPSVRTVHRILVRRGLVTAQPKKRPKAAYIRFERSLPNEMWQMDATLWRLATRRTVWIIDLVDDFSRYALEANVYQRFNTDTALDCIQTAIGNHGRPVQLLTDNGTQFSSHFGASHRFDDSLAGYGIGHINSAPAHPQTCGKMEAFHHTLKQWLRQQPLSATIHELQNRLDSFRNDYNTQRPHTANDADTPADAYQALPKARPGMHQTPVDYRKVTPTGVINWNSIRIDVGTIHTGKRLLVVASRQQTDLYDRHHHLGYINHQTNLKYQRMVSTMS